MKAISLFSGAGGIDLGFHKAGFKILYSTDNWKLACETLRKNELSVKVECKDIHEIDFKKLLKDLKLKKVDCVMGGPPCPPYSKSRFYLTTKQRSMKDSTGFHTLTGFFKAIEEIRPSVFFFENVHGFFYKPHQDAFDYLKSKSEELGYKLTYGVINTADYGVPQIRERFICVGTKKQFPRFVFPEKTHTDINKSGQKTISPRRPWVTCGEAIGDLDYPLPQDIGNMAGSKHRDLLKLIPPGENYLYLTEKRKYPNPKFKWRSRYWSFLLKLSKERPSWTIQASHSNNMGPFHWTNRFLRIEEIKRIQTFDDNYLIEGNFKEKWRQIGNAFPPLAAKVFAEEIKKQIFKK